jgi:hypothetical protein
MAITYQDNNNAILVSTYAYANYVVWELFKVTPSMVGRSIYCNPYSSTAYIVTSVDNWSTWGTGVGSNPYTLKDEDVGKAVGFLTYTYGQQTATVTNASVNFGSTATAYEPYSGAEYSVTFPSEAGTLYGGYVDYERGEVVATWQKVVVSSSNTSVRTPGYYGRYMRTVLTGCANGSDVDIVCDVLAKVANSDFNAGATGFQRPSSSQPNIYWQTPDCATEEGASALIDSGYEFVFELSTPITYPITPTIIKTLKGANTIWSDTNGNVDIKYWKH